MNIWCVGRNYSEHAKELGNQVPTEPMIFLKAGSCLVEDSNEFKIPSYTSEIHHEVELVIRIDSDLQITHFTVGLDLTDRSAQNKAKKEGLPWTLAKSFKNSAPIAKWVRFRSQNHDLNQIKLNLYVNNSIKQSGKTSDMIFKVSELIQSVANSFPVQAGDLIFTGTPSGVGPLKIGDRVKVELLDLQNNKLVEHSWTVS